MKGERCDVCNARLERGGLRLAGTVEEPRLEEPVPPTLTSVFVQVCPLKCRLDGERLLATKVAAARARLPQVHGLRAYDHALTPEEIAALYAAGPPEEE